MRSDSPVCPIYKDEVTEDQDGKCSLCGSELSDDGSCKATMLEQAIIIASGLYLSFPLPRDIPFGGSEMVEFIENNELNLYENEPVEVILNLIEGTAKTLVDFVESQKEDEETITARWLNKHIDSGDVDLLGYSADADIWYDAKDHNDLKVAATITATQNAMSSISTKLHTVMSGGNDE